MKEIFEELAKEILHLSSLYHHHATTRATALDSVDWSAISTSKATSGESQRALSPYTLHTQPETLEELVKSFAIGGYENSLLVPNPTTIANKLEEIQAMKFSKNEHFKFRVNFLVNAVHDRVAKMLDGARNVEETAVKGLQFFSLDDGLDSTVQAELRLRHEVDTERLTRCAMQIQYLENVVRELERKANTQRTFYYRELSELKLELSEMTSTALGGGKVSGRETSLLEQSETFLTTVEEQVYRALLQNEKKKNDQLGKWVSNLKTQLQIERLRDRAMDSDKGINKTSTPSLLAASNTTASNEDKIYIKELLDQISTLSKRIDMQQPPPPQVVYQQDPKLVQQIERLENQLRPLQQKLGDLSRENMMISARNRELQEKWEVAEQKSAREDEKRVIAVDGLKSEIKVLKALNDAMREKKEEKEGKRAREKELEKRVAELDGQNILLKARVNELVKEMDSYKSKSAVAESKIQQVPAIVKREVAVVEKDAVVAKTPAVEKSPAVKKKEAWKEEEKNTAEAQTKPKQPSLKPPAAIVEKKKTPPFHPLSSSSRKSPTAVPETVAKEKEQKGEVIIQETPPPQRTEHAKPFSFRKPLLRSKSMPIISKTSLESMSSTSLLLLQPQRSKSLPTLFPLNYIKRDKPFRVWMLSYAADRKKIVERVCRRWARLVKRLKDRSEKQRLLAQERGSKYFTFAINKLELPKSGNGQSSSKNVFQRLQDTSISVRKKEALEKVKEEREKSSRWVIEERPGNFISRFQK